MIEKRPVGRPTKYKEEFCEQVIELGKQGYSKAMIAATLDIARETLDEWIDSIP
jgi:transposase-like protein